MDYLALYLSVFLTVISQLLLKVAANSNRIRFSRTVYLSLAYGILLIALGFNIYGLRSVPLIHMAYILPATFILVPIMSILFLGEHQRAKFWVGCGLVVAGTLVFNMG